MRHEFALNEENVRTVDVKLCLKLFKLVSMVSSLHRMPCSRNVLTKAKYSVLPEILVRFACVVISVVTYAIGKHLVELHKMLPWGAKMAGCLNFNAAMPFGVLIMELYQGKGDVDHSYVL